VIVCQQGRCPHRVRSVAVTRRSLLLLGELRCPFGASVGALILVPFPGEATGGRLANLPYGSVERAVTGEGGEP